MMPLLVRVDDLEARTTSQYAFTRSPVRVGRNPLNDLSLESSFVSQWHAVIQFGDQGTHYFDLGSTNGTIINGQRAGKNVPMPLDGSVEVRIGSLRMFFARAPVPPGVRVAGGGSAIHSFSETTDRGDHTQLFDSPGAPLSDGEFNPEATTAYDPGGRHAPHVPHVAPAAPSARQLQDAVARLKPLYDAYRRSWNALYQGVTELLRSVPPAMQSTLLGHLDRELPAMSSEEQFRALAQGQRVALRGPGGLGGAAAQILAQFAQYTVPHRPPPQTSQEVEAVLVRAAAVLDAFAASFVALKKGQEQFGTEMALPHHRGIADGAQLEQARDPRAVVAYLLDWTAPGDARLAELTSAYADVMIHQVALLNGLMEGVRSLLHRLGPTHIAREADEAPVRLGPLRLPRALWPFRAAARWRRYVERHREFTEEDREITAAVFGAEFARAYAGVVGENYAPNGPARLNETNRR